MTLFPISTSSAAAAPAIRLFGDGLARKALLVLAGTLLLAVCAWIEAPMIPVPMTMQTFGMVLIGGLYGWRLGALTVCAYLAEGAMGLPVFAGGAAGPLHLVGPTAGYLFAFPLAAVLVGALAQAGATARLWSSALVMLAGHALIIALGVSWLAVATGMGWQAAFAAGATPFLLGMGLKSALAALALRGAQSLARRAG